MYCSRCGSEVQEGSSFCKSCGAEVPPPATPHVPAVAKTAVMPPPPPPSVWQTPPPSPPRRNRTGLIVGVVAAVVILAGGGTAAAILLTRDKGGSSTTLLTSTTITTTSSGTNPGTTATGTGATTTTTRTGQSAYVEALIELEQTLSTADGYVTALGDEAGRTTPDIPQSIVDELQQTFQDIERARMNLLRLDLPPEYDEADYWIQDAAVALQSRVDYAMQGISAIWYVGLTEAGEPYFAEARAQSDYFQEAFANYFDSLPD